MQHRHHGLDVLPGLRHLQAEIRQDVRAIIQHIEFLRLAGAVHTVFISHGRQRLKIVFRSIPVQKIIEFQQIHGHAAHRKFGGAVVAQPQRDVRIIAGGVCERDLLFVRHDREADLDSRVRCELIGSQLPQHFHILGRLVDPYRQSLRLIFHIHRFIHVVREGIQELLDAGSYAREKAGRRGGQFFAGSVQIDAVQTQVLLINIRQGQGGKLCRRAGIVAEKAQLVRDFPRLFRQPLQILNCQHQIGDISGLHSADILQRVINRSQPGRPALEPLQNIRHILQDVPGAVGVNPCAFIGIIALNPLQRNARVVDLIHNGQQLLIRGFHGPCGDFQTDDMNPARQIYACIQR